MSSTAMPLIKAVVMGVRMAPVRASVSHSSRGLLVGGGMVACGLIVVAMVVDVGFWRR